MNTKRITLYLYEDEYQFMQDKSKEKRLSMNKIIQLWIRDQLGRSVHSDIKTKEDVKKVLTHKEVTKLEKEPLKFSKMLNKWI